MKMNTSAVSIHYWGLGPFWKPANSLESHCVQSMLEDWRSWNMMLMEDSGSDSSSSINTTHWRRKAADKTSVTTFSWDLFVSELLVGSAGDVALAGRSVKAVTHHICLFNTLEESKRFQLSCPEQDNIPHTDHVPQRRKEKTVLVNVNYRRTALV